MEIKLNKLTIENFKGIKSFEVELEGDNAVITAENGAGKTTIYDAFLWLLFGKNSEGRKDFSIRPLDKDNQPIKGLVVSVEAFINIDDDQHNFRKEHHEKVVKDQLRGYETYCWFDEIPKKIGEFQEIVDDIISEETFKLLADLTHFNSKLHWNDRRKVLMDIAGEVTLPKTEAFTALAETLNGRNIKDYKKVLRDRKKKYTDELNEINPRIDELQKGHEGYVVDEGIADIQADREERNAELAELDEQRKTLLTSEQERQKRVEQINVLKNKLANRERELANDTSDIQALLDEKNKANIACGLLQETTQQLANTLKLLEGQSDTAKAQLQESMKIVATKQREYKTASEKPVDENCYACGQRLPANKLAEVEEKRTAELADITKRGEEVFAEVQTGKEECAKFDAKLKELRKLHDEGVAKYIAAREEADERFAEIDEAISNRKAPDFTQDLAWKKITAEIKTVEGEIGDPLSDQIQKMDDKRNILVNDIAQLDKALAHADRMKQDRKRITELEAKEKELAQQIADIDKLFDDISEYEMTESRLVEEKVNGLFEYTTFKLFKYLLNESIEPKCEAMFNGVSYSDMSTGQKILVGLDIINVLSEHEDVSVCLFIDHIESLTLPLETKAQVIGLKTVKGVKKLTVEKVESKERQIA